MTAAEIAAAAAAAAVATPEPAAAVEPAAVVVEPTPAAAPAPWAKEAEARFTDPAARDAFDTYMREVNQPYVTRLEQERAEAANKTWVHDQLNERPESLSEIAEQLYPGLGEQVAALITAGATPEVAAAAAAVEADPEEIPLTQLPADVREAVEFARDERARQATAATAQAQAEAETAAAAEYDTWRAATLAAQTDIKETVLHRYVAAANVPEGATSEQLFAQALADYRTDFPAPTVVAPATIGGHTVANGGDPAKPPKTMREATERIWAAASGGKES